MARYPRNDANYEVADLYRERCLLDQESFLWPGHQVWTPENIGVLLDAFIGNPDHSNRTFIEKWDDQLAELPEDIHRLAVDVLAFFYLFPSNVRGSTKMSRVRAVMEWKLADDVPDLSLLTRAFEHGVGSAGQYFLSSQPNQVAYFLELFRDLIDGKASPNEMVSCKALADEVRDRVSGSVPARHIALHLLFPDHFERIASETHKRKIAAAFADRADGATDLDDALLSIRRSFERERGTPFDFYDAPDLRVQWSGAAPPDEPTVGPSGDGPDVAEVEPGTLTSLADSVNLPVEEAEELVGLLQERRQIILEGPPGAGKTYVAEKLARYFSGNSLDGDYDERIELVQFHQSYGYEDFVQGIRPETNASGQLEYHVRDGVFKRFCARASARPAQRFVMIIDEINRGNISRILGELLLLLEYRDRKITLPYSQTDEAQFSIPENVYLIATMNTADRSLAQIDYALRRRFYFVRLLPVVDGSAPTLRHWLAKQSDIPVQDQRDVLRWFLALNELVEEYLGEHFQIGHSYFMRPDIATEQGRKRVWQRSLLPLLEEYFYTQRDRESILQSFEALTARSTISQTEQDLIEAEAGVETDE